MTVVMVTVVMVLTCMVAIADFTALATSSLDSILVSVVLTKAEHTHRE